MDESMLDKRTPTEGIIYIFNLYKFEYKYNSSLGAIHKRTPQRPASVPTDIYISNKSKTSAIVKRVRRLMLKEK
jgi:hypothetical protein